MIKRLLNYMVAFMCVLISSICLFAGCGSVVPCAWVKLDMEGYIAYTSYAYPGHGHILLYENEDDSKNDTYTTNYAINIEFLPRILGADTVNGIKTTIVDISSYSEMAVYINKNKSVYDSDKKIYLNDKALTPTLTNNFDTLLCLTFDNLALTRGNPGGKFNEFINVIEYK